MINKLTDAVNDIGVQLWRLRSGLLDGPELCDVCDDLGKLLSMLSTVPQLLIGILDTHTSPLAREGALEGLARIIDNPAARAAIERAAKHDQSEILRKLAMEILDEEHWGSDEDKNK